jgi:hypothetical protein
VPSRLGWLDRGGIATAQASGRDVPVSTIARGTAGAGVPEGGVGGGKVREMQGKGIYGRGVTGGSSMRKARRVGLATIRVVTVAMPKYGE